MKRMFLTAFFSRSPIEAEKVPVHPVREQGLLQGQAQEVLLRQRGGDVQALHLRRVRR